MKMRRKEVIQAINLVAKVDFEVAKVMLEGWNYHWGTAYGWLNKRVVIFDNPYATIAEKYAHCHDAECYIDE